VTAGKTSGVQTTINNQSDNRMITCTGTSNTLNAEQYLTYTSQSSLNLTDGVGTSNLGGNYLLLKRSTGTTNYIAAPNADAVLDISADETIRFGTVNTADFNSTERMRIDSSGKVGIGKTSPTFRLDVEDSTNNTLRLGHSGESGHGSHEVKIAAGRNYYHTIRFEGSSYRFLGYDGSSINEKFRVRSTGGVTFNGDTADANALEDYEEGTFTPTLPNGTSLTNSGAYYVKIGRFVNFYCYITSLNIPNNSNAFRVGGLPYTVLSGMYGGPCSISYTGSANDSRIAALAPNVQTNDTYIYFHTTGIGEGFTLANSHFQVMNSGNLNIQGCYMTAQ